MSDEEGTKTDVVPEFNRQYRVVDQLMSIHSSLRDGYDRRAFVLNTCQVGVSLFLCVLAFVGDEVIESAGFESTSTRLLLASVATLLLLLAITEYRVDWKSRAAIHGTAVGRLAALKAVYRGSRGRIRQGDGEEWSDVDEQYHRVMGRLPPIPERRFAGLKAAHQFKVVLSKRSSANPAGPGWYLGLLLRVEGMWKESRDWWERR